MAIHVDTVGCERREQLHDFQAGWNADVTHRGARQCATKRARHWWVEMRSLQEAALEKRQRSDVASVVEDVNDRLEAVMSKWK